MKERAAIATQAQSQAKVPSIQALRGIAASLVVFSHYSMIYGEFASRPSWIVARGIGDIGACGVDLFFVISGFIMVYTTVDKSGPRDAFQFIERRALRIFPLYWLWTSVLLLLWGAGFALTKTTLSARYIVSSYLLAPYYNGHNYHPVLGQGWTLSFEILFYAVFACALVVRPRWGRLPVLALSFAALFMLGHTLVPEGALRYLVTDPIIVEFLFGACAAEVLLRVDQRPGSALFKRGAAALVCAGAVALLCTPLLSQPENLRALVYGVPGLAIVLGLVVCQPVRVPGFLVYLGDASYSIYLTHAFCARAYTLVLRRSLLVSSVPADLAIPVLSVITILFTSLSYPLIERPLTRVIKILREGQGRTNRGAGYPGTR